jgi:hypothetical protein
MSSWVQGGHLTKLLMFSRCRSCWLKPLAGAHPPIVSMCTYTQQRPSKVCVCVIGEHIIKDMSFLFTTQLAQHKYSKGNAYARSMCKQIVWTSSKCGNTKTPSKVEETMVSISCWRICILLRSRLWKEQVVNILEAIRGEFGKNTYGKMSKSSTTCVQTNHRKEQVFIEFVATQVIFIQK